MLENKIFKLLFLRGHLGKVLKDLRGGANKGAAMYYVISWWDLYQIKM